VDADAHDGYSLSEVREVELAQHREKLPGPTAPGVDAEGGRDHARLAELCAARAPHIVKTHVR